MPNWCSNTLTIAHEDPAEIQRAADAFRRGEFLQELVPNPAGEWNYDWSCANWGTKWDVGGRDYGDPEVSKDGRSMTVYFDSAWAPPVQAYESMVEKGFGVEAMYYESGMAFAGVYSDGCDDYYEFSNMNSEEVKNMLPQDLDDYFAISETIAEYEDEEPLTEWYVKGVEEKGLK